MCGRFSLTTNDYESVAQALGAELHPEVSAAYRARYNVAPTDPSWIEISGEVTRQFAILTTASNDLVAPYHDRMPVILDTNDAHLWLDAPGVGDRGRDAVLALGSVLRAVPNDWLVAEEVDRRVGDVRNDDPSLLEPPEPEPPKPKQQRLF